MGNTISSNFRGLQQKYLIENNSSDTSPDKISNQKTYHESDVVEENNNQPDIINTENSDKVNSCVEKSHSISPNELNFGTKLPLNTIKPIMIAKLENPSLNKFPQIKIQDLLGFFRQNKTIISNDEYISKSEIKAAIENPRFNIQEKAILMRLYENYDLISEQSKDFMFQYDNSMIDDKVVGIHENDLQKLLSRSLKNKNDPLILQIENTAIHSLKHIDIIGKSHIYKPSPNTEEWGSFIKPLNYGLDKIQGNQDQIHTFKMQWIRGYKETIKNAAREFDIPPLLLAGVAYKEVGGAPLIEDDIVRFARSNKLYPGNPNNTSFGNLSIQISTAAEVLGYDFKNLTKEQEEVIISSLKDPKESLYIAANNLAILKRIDFGNKRASDLSDEEIKITATRHMMGGAISINEVKKTSGYGADIIRLKEELLNSLK